MVRTSVFAAVCTGIVLLGSGRAILADTYPIIIKGSVIMEDGSPPPFTVGIERICSDAAGSAPGPITNKKGEWIWRLEIDAFASRSCVFRATHPGYSSSTADASALNTTSHNTTLTIPPLVIGAAATDPYAINVSESNMPAKSKGPFEKAMKALDATNFEEAADDLKAAVAGSPRFAQGWHALGIIEERLHKPDEARDAYTHAIEADPKLLTAYVTLSRLCIKTKDWQCAAKTADSLIKADTKRGYAEIYLHRAVARYELKDLPGAEESAQEALRLDPKHKRPREEYVLGRILEAKGDAAGARDHFTKYLELEPNPPDGALVKGHLENIGKPAAQGVDPELEPL
jgi:Tfp pilus assembly protein PilF